jgi:hypothetical protein
MNEVPTIPDLDAEVATRYLLGELSEAERARLERRLLEDGRASDLAAAAEDDLLDAWATGELPRRRRLAFERRLRGSAELRRRAAFARALARAAGSGAAAGGRIEAEGGRVVAWPGGRRGFAAPLASLAAAAAVLLAIACGWLLWRGGRLADQVVDLERETAAVAAERDALASRSGDFDRRLASERTAAADLEHRLEAQREQLAELERLARERAAAPPAPVTASFVLSAALRSEIGPRRLELPAAVEQVRLTLDLGAEEDFPGYLAVLHGPSGREVWSRRGLAPAAGGTGTTVELELPAALLAAGRHEALLYGEPRGGGEPEPPPELVGAFEFEAVRR